MNTHFQSSCVLWLCGGDFNEFLWDYDKYGGSSILYNRFSYLATFMNKAELFDLNFNGLPGVVQEMESWWKRD